MQLNFNQMLLISLFSLFFLHTLSKSCTVDNDCPLTGWCNKTESKCRAIICTYGRKRPPNNCSNDFIRIAVIQNRRCLCNPSNEQISLCRKPICFSSCTPICIDDVCTFIHMSNCSTAGVPGCIIQPMVCDPFNGDCPVHPLCNDTNTGAPTKRRVIGGTGPPPKTPQPTDKQIIEEPVSSTVTTATVMIILIILIIVFLCLFAFLRKQRR